MAQLTLLVLTLLPALAFAARDIDREADVPSLDMKVSRCEVSIKGADVRMPTFYIPSSDMVTFRDAVAGAETELRREAAVSLSQATTEDEKIAVQEMMNVEFMMRCVTGKLAEHGDHVRCQMCNYHQSPTSYHLVQGTVLDTTLESCMTGYFENSQRSGTDFHPTCFPELPNAQAQPESKPSMRGQRKEVNKQTIKGRSAAKEYSMMGEREIKTALRNSIAEAVPSYSKYAPDTENRYYETYEMIPMEEKMIDYDLTSYMDNDSANLYDDGDYFLTADEFNREYDEPQIIQYV